MLLAAIPAGILSRGQIRRRLNGPNVVVVTLPPVGSRVIEAMTNCRRNMKRNLVDSIASIYLRPS